jgi:hypothetical protein
MAKRKAEEGKESPSRKRSTEENKAENILTQNDTFWSNWFENTESVSLVSFGMLEIEVVEDMWNQINEQLPFVFLGEWKSDNLPAPKFVRMPSISFDNYNLKGVEDPWYTMYYNRKDFIELIQKASEKMIGFLDEQDVNSEPFSKGIMKAFRPIKSYRDLKDALAISTKIMQKDTDLVALLSV